MVNCIDELLDGFPLSFLFSQLFLNLVACWDICGVDELGKVVGGGEPTVCLVVDVVCELELNFCDVFMAVKSTSWEAGRGRCCCGHDRGLLILLGHLCDRGRVVTGLDGSGWMTQGLTSSVWTHLSL